VSIQCTNCGQALPRDDAQFCNKCGTPVQQRPRSPQALSTLKDAPVTSDGKGKAYKGRPALREQIAQQPSFQPPRRPRVTQDFPPPWISELSTLEHSKTSTPKVEKDQPPLTEVMRDQVAEISTTSLPQVEAKRPAQDQSLTEKAGESVDTDQSDTPTVIIAPRKSQVRELHVKVWEQEESPAAPEKPEREDSSKELTHLPPDDVATPKDPTKRESNILADFPTMPVNVEGTNGRSRPPSINWGSSTPRADANMSLPSMVSKTPRIDEVTHLETEHLPTQLQVKTGADDVIPISQANRAGSKSFPGIEAGSQTQRWGRPPQIQPANRTPMIKWEAKEQSTPIGQYTPAFAQHASTRRRRSPFPFLFAILFLFVVVAGGLLVWTFVYQPFTVSPVSQPQQSFQNAALGVALSYPNGWMVQVDQNNGSAQFSDSTHTARFSITVVAAAGQDPGKYLLQEAKQLAITGEKSGPPLSFAKTSWQQVQGSVVQDGVNYTETLLVTVHANRLYSVIQQAPQATYADEDQVVFSTMRSSFQFLL
jgi:predicted  nucleic acid-binding Zn-ribbon protein